MGFLNTAGITESVTQNNIAVGMNALQIVFAGLGCIFVDRLGRRPMLIGVNAACCVCWIGVTVACSQAAKTGSKTASAATVAMVYIFQICFSFGWTPMQALYPVEVLSFEMRAKGMAFSNLFVAAGTLPLSQTPAILRLIVIFLRWYGKPVRIPRCAAKHCLEDVYCLLRLVRRPDNRYLLLHSGDEEPHSTFSYSLSPSVSLLFERRLILCVKSQLEELDDIFAQPNPRKASTEKKKLGLDQNANIVNVAAIDVVGGQEVERPIAA